MKLHRQTWEQSTSIKKDSEKTDFLQKFFCFKKDSSFLKKSYVTSF